MHSMESVPLTLMTSKEKMSQFLHGSRDPSWRKETCSVNLNAVFCILFCSIILSIRVSSVPAPQQMLSHSQQLAAALARRSQPCLKLSEKRQRLCCCERCGDESLSLQPFPMNLGSEWAWRWCLSSPPNTTLQMFCQGQLPDSPTVVTVLIRLQYTST